MSILKIRNADGTISEFPVLVGPKGDKGDPGDVIDVKINGTSILDENKVANIPIAEVGWAGAKPGVVAYSTAFSIDSSKRLQLNPANSSELSPSGSRTDGKAIAASNLDEAVKVAMCDGKGAAWSDTEKKAAQERIGIDVSAITAKDNRQDADIENLKASAKGVLYREEVEDDVAREKTVPSGAMPNAFLSQLGGMSRKGKNIGNFVGGINTTIVNGWLKVTDVWTKDNSASVSVPIPDNTQFSISFLAYAEESKGCFYVLFYKDETYESVNFSIGTSKEKKYNTLIRSKPITNIRIGSNNGFLYLKNIQVEYGSSVTDYEPYTDQLIDAKVDKVVSSGKNLSTMNGRLNASNICISDTLKSGKYVLSWKGHDKEFNLKKNSQNGESIITTNTSDRSCIFTLNEDAKIFVNGWGNTCKQYDVQIEAGEVATSYAAPREPITTTIQQSIISLCPDYGIGINSDCYNYIDFENKKYHRRIGSVDLGACSWERMDTTNNDFRFFTHAINSLAKKSTTNILCSKYDKITAEESWNENTLVGCCMNTVGNELLVKDMSYTDEASFKSAMSGVMLYYELAEEQIIDLSSVWSEDLNILPVEAGGTISFHYPQLDNGYSVDMPNTIDYLIDVEEAI